MKLKLNIQYFGSTNKTTHYDLSQYVANDKPTYLVDYNSDMSKIDAGIYSAESKATVNEGAIGDISNLQTTVKTDLVSAVNEVKAEANDNKGDITTLNTSVSANTGNIGVMANLQTTDKTNLVSAINEVKGVNDTQNTNINKNAINIQAIQSEVEKFNLSVFKTYATTDLTDPTKFQITNFNSSRSELNVATNSDGSIFKLYGFIRGQVVNGTSVDIKLKNTGIVPTSAFNVNGAGILNFYTDSNFNSTTYSILASFSVDSNGDITIHSDIPVNWYSSFMFTSSLYFAKDFGDIPE